MEEAGHALMDELECLGAFAVFLVRTMSRARTEAAFYMIVKTLFFRFVSVERRSAAPYVVARVYNFENVRHGNAAHKRAEVFCPVFTDFSHYRKSGEVFF